MFQLRNFTLGVRLIPEGEIRRIAPGNDSLVRTRLQVYAGGMYWYDAQRHLGEPSFAKLFHTVWNIMFTPAPPLQKRIIHELKRMQLVPYQYAAAHVRVLYAMDSRQERIKRNWAINAIHCASELHPGAPIFFTSDSANASYYAKQYAREKLGNYKVETLERTQQPIHLDKELTFRPPSDFYDAFVDLYLLGLATCVTYNKGGYGHLGLLLSRNVTCGLRQDAMDRPKIHKPCHWVDAPAIPQQPWPENQPLFRPPMAN